MAKHLGLLALNMFPELRGMGLRERVQGKMR